VKYLPEKEQEILDRHVGKCMEGIEAIRIDKVPEGIIKDLVRKQMRYLAADLVEVQDDND
jgi:hypothetical protein